MTLGTKSKVKPYEFEWPKTVQILNGNLDQVRLHWFSTRANSSLEIEAVRVELSNGQSSYSNGNDKDKKGYNAMQFDPGSDVNRVMAGSLGSSISEIIFRLDNGNVKQKSYQMGQLSYSVDLPENSSIVGVYGKSDGARLSSLGFVLIMPK